MAGELKWFDISMFQSNPNNERIWGSICNMVQGTKQWQRIGRTATLKWIGWRYTVGMSSNLDQGTPNRSDCIRCIVFLDKQANGEDLPTGGELLQDVSGAFPIQRFPNIDQEDRFEILYDKTHNMRYGGIASETQGDVTQPGTRECYVWSTTVDIPLVWDSIGNLRSNNVGILMNTISGLVNISGVTRVRFTDD